jgi:hypothetical protein
MFKPKIREHFNINKLVGCVSLVSRM